MATGWKWLAIVQLAALFLIAVLMTRNEERVSMIVQALPLMREEGKNRLEDHDAQLDAQEARIGKLEQHAHAPHANPAPVPAPAPAPPPKREHPVLDFIIKHLTGH